jgi:hypothetical protein
MISDDEWWDVLDCCLGSQNITEKERKKWCLYEGGQRKAKYKDYAHTVSDESRRYIPD